MPLWFSLACSVVLGSLACAAGTSGIRDAATNPIAWADIPNLAVIRVGVTRTAKATIYCASVATGLVLAQFAKWLRRLPVDSDVTLNLLADELTCAIDT